MTAVRNSLDNHPVIKTPLKLSIALGTEQQVKERTKSPLELATLLTSQYHSGIVSKTEQIID